MLKPLKIAVFQLFGWVCMYRCKCHLYARFILIVSSGSIKYNTPQLTSVYVIIIGWNVLGKTTLCFDHGTKHQTRPKYNLSKCHPIPISPSESDSMQTKFEAKETTFQGRKRTFSRISYIFLFIFEGGPLNNLCPAGTIFCYILYFFRLTLDELVKFRVTPLS